MHKFTNLTIIFITCMTWIATQAAENKPIDVVNQWMNSCSQLDIDGMTSTYFKDSSSFLTIHRELVIGQTGVSDYLRNATAAMDPTTMECQFTPYTNIQNSEQQATIAGWDKITGKIDGEAFANEGRTSFILNKRKGIWKISHFHRSPLPTIKE